MNDEFVKYIVLNKRDEYLVVSAWYVSEQRYVNVLIHKKDCKRFIEKEIYFLMGRALIKHPPCGLYIDVEVSAIYPYNAVDISVDNMDNIDGYMVSFVENSEYTNTTWRQFNGVE